MRTLLIALSLLTIVAVVVSGTLIFVAQQHPFAPGDALYGLQRFAEKAGMALRAGVAARADLAIDLAHRRLEDLALADEASLEIAAAEFSAALDDAVLRVSQAPADEQERLVQRVGDLLERVSRVLAGLPDGSPALADLRTRVAALIVALELAPQQVATAASGGAAPITGESVPFLELYLNHRFFPLAGAHAAAACETCHAGGRYAGTPTECTACHQTPAGHFPGECAACHSLDGWSAIIFAHQDHYQGQCSRCHSTVDWRDVTFDHTGLTNCLNCHSEEMPAGHFTAECTICHVTTDWTEIIFDHTGADDCLECHAAELPANHFPGACINCHNTEEWSQVTFSHTGFTDCAGCHSADAPPNPGPRRHSATPV
jgi:hypothetical protein